MPGDPDQVIVTGVTGTLAAGLMDRTAPLAGSLAGQAIRSGKPSLITGDRLEAAAAALGAGIGPLIAVPLAAGERVLGALMLGRTAARPGFTESDLGMAASFAGHAAVAMELAEARADQILLAQAEDHDRIAGDLHDQVIQELFALGMKLQGQAARSDPATAERVNGYVDTLDEVIRNIRTSIFGLRQPRQAPAGLQARVMEIIEEHAPQLGFTASVSFTVPPGPGPDETLAHDILAVTREALSNCARHARATAVSIALALQDGLITLEVTDNGRGLGTPARSSGLASMRRRAENNGGTLQITAPAGGGTRLTWTARPRHGAGEARMPGLVVNDWCHAADGNHWWWSDRRRGLSVQLPEGQRQPRRVTPVLLAGHGHPHLAVGVGDEVAGQVDGDGVEGAGEGEGGPGSPRRSRSRGWRRR